VYVIHIDHRDHEEAQADLVSQTETIMTTAAHTAGPWEAIGGNIFPCDVSQLAPTHPVADGIKSNIRMYAVASVMAPERWRDGNAAEVLEANARLIAASPEMLDALEFADRFFSMFTPLGGADELAQAWDKTAAVVRAAIAKSSKR
jgi:hypothetical protein